MNGDALADRESLTDALRSLLPLFRHGGSPLGQAKLAKESGLANNTVAAGHVELLTDLLCLSYEHAWDPQKRVRIMR